MQKLCVETFKQLQLQKEINSKSTKKQTQMKRYYGKLWNELCNNGEEEIGKELRNEMKVENRGLIKWKSAGTCKKQEMGQLR